jgi:hypothetical protein
MTKAAGKVSETDYRFDCLQMKKGDYYNLVYYTSYGWQSAAGVYLEDSTADTDLVNCGVDELRIIEYKASELGERHLRNYSNADRMLGIYQKYISKYQFDNPSEALILTSIYHITDM